MKKDTVLSLIAAVLLFFAVRSLVAEVVDDCPTCPRVAGYISNGQKRVEYYKEAQGDIDCQECCKQGRFASEECFRKCGACEAYADIGKAEAHDYPNN